MLVRMLLMANGILVEQISSLSRKNSFVSPLPRLLSKWLKQPETSHLIMFLDTEKNHLPFSQNFSEGFQLFSTWVSLLWFSTQF
jgi:hypothetical protein